MFPVDPIYISPTPFPDQPYIVYSNLLIHSVYYISKKYAKHRRRIELEDKAKVVSSGWETESLPR